MPIADRFPCLSFAIDAAGRGRVRSYRRWRARPAAENHVALDRVRDADRGTTGCEILVRPRALSRAFCRRDTGVGPDRRFRLRRDRTGEHVAHARAPKCEGKREGMARLAQQARGGERDPDQPRRALPPWLRGWLGRIQSTIASSSRVATDLSFRAPPFLDRCRRHGAIGRTSFQWIDRHPLALRTAGCPIRDHLQLATFLLS